MQKDQIRNKSLADAELLAKLAKGEREPSDSTPAADQGGQAPRAGRWLTPSVVLPLVRVTEFLLTALVGLQVAHIYLSAQGETLNVSYMVVIAAASAAVPFIFQTLALYTVEALRTVLRQTGRIAMGWTGLFGVLAILAFVAKVGPEFSRAWLIMWYGFGLIMVLSVRAGIGMLVHHWNRHGLLERHAVIVGGGKRGADLIQALDETGDTDIRIVGVFDDRGDDRSPPQIAGYPKLGNVDELIEFGRKSRIDLLIVTLPITAENRLLELLHKLWILPVDIRLSAHTNKLRFRPRAYSYIGQVPFIDVFDRPLADWDYITKTIEDRVIAALALILLSPLMLLVALAVKLDSRGPVLFKQKRYGFNNQLVEVYKFRSLKHESADANASKLVTRNDDRVTRVGRFIRKTSLDELPQFFNVLTGDLSLVGPRPHAVMATAEDNLYVDVVEGYYARHRVKPGITGWAQINGWRGETDTAEKIQRRVEYDLYYIENWSLWLDLYILAMTPLSLLKSQNAY